MKQRVLIALIIFFLIAGFSYAGTDEEIIEETNQKGKPYVTFKYGAAAAWVTRIIEQKERSNFVLKNFLPGAYFTTELQNLLIITPEVRLTAFYPLISSFNSMPQKMKSPLNFGADLFLGARYEIGLGFFKLSAGLGPHVFYMSSERWYYVNLGIGAVTGFELALHPKWTLLIDGYAFLDNANLGQNKLMEPFKIAYQYQTSFGVRYSKKMLNEPALVKSKKVTRSKDKTENDAADNVIQNTNSLPLILDR